MKRCSVVFFTLLFGCTYAQPIISSFSQRSLQEISKQTEVSRNDLELEFPIHQIKGLRYVSTIAKVEPWFDQDRLPYGFVLSTRIGSIVTLKVPISAIEDIVQLEGVKFLEVAGKIVPDISKAVLDMRVDSVHNAWGTFNSYTGKNVIIGVTDWGFDYTHPMFYDSTLSHSRILASWDQFKQSGPAPTGMTYGTEYDGSIDLTQAKSDTACVYYDYAMHGSHVAGIAGGGGAGIGYVGSAYDANFLFSQMYLDAGAAIDAVSWMKDYATKEGKPLVVNMSWGLYHLGPPDGNSLLSQALDQFSNQGVTIITSNGNNGNEDFHIKKTFANDTLTSQIEFYNYSFHPKMWGQNILIWGEQGKSFNVYLDVWDGSNYYSSKDIGLHLAPFFDSILVIGTDTIFYETTIDAAFPQNGRPHIQLKVKNENPSLKVILKAHANNGTVHFWNVTHVSDGSGNWGMPFVQHQGMGVSGDENYGVGEPASTKTVIAVGAHASEVRIGGAIYEGGLANFSSVGPTLDERVKPDITAPGFNIISSISSYTTRAYNKESTVQFNGRSYDFAPFSGTSMSAPALTGVVALMLEAEPKLTPADIKQILMATAREDSKTGTLPSMGSNEWGHGKVTATEALREVMNRVSLNEFSLSSALIYPTIVENELLLLLEEPFKASILDINGRTLQRDIVERKVNAHLLKPGYYFLKIETKEQVFIERFIKI